MTYVMSLFVAIIPTEETWCSGDMALACMVPITLIAAVLVTKTSGLSYHVDLIDIVSLTWCMFTIVYAYVVTFFL